jgi:UDP-glucose 4-epimerase
MNKILVTGGAGFIGSNIVSILVEQGYKVTVLDDLSSGHSCNLDAFQDVEFIQGDVRDEHAVEKSIKGAVGVIHLAASVGNKRSIDNPILDSEINVIGTLRILEACRKAGVPKIVYSSSAGIYGELKHLPIKEDHPIAPNSPYGASKLAAEKLSLAYAHLYDIEAVCLRYFNVYGPNQRFDEYGNVIPLFAFKILNGESLTVFGDGEQTRDFVNVRDVAQANLKALQAKGVSDAFNIASSTKITINKLVNILVETSGRSTDVNHGPIRPGDVRHSLADISAASEAIGYEPSVNIEDGIMEYMSWAKTEVSQ